MTELFLQFWHDKRVYTSISLYMQPVEEATDVTGGHQTKLISAHCSRYFVPPNFLMRDGAIFNLREIRAH